MGTVTLSDLDFAHDIALLSNQLREAQELLSRVERVCGKVGVHLNPKKTEFFAFNIEEHIALLETINGAPLKRVVDFKYLGSRMESTEKDIKTRKALAWKALHDMKGIWKRQLLKKLKLRFFHAAIETILLYGCEAWSLAKAMTKSLDGCYTRMLRMVQDVS